MCQLGGLGGGAEKGHTRFLFAASSSEALLRGWAACSEGSLAISFPRGAIWSLAVPSVPTSSTHGKGLLGLSHMAKGKSKKRYQALQSLLPIQQILPPPLSAFPFSASSPFIGIWGPVPPTEAQPVLCPTPLLSIRLCSASIQTHALRGTVAGPQLPLREGRPPTVPGSLINLSGGVCEF